MDELSFRRRIYEYPQDSSQDILEEINNDKQKAKFKAEMMAFDELLVDSLKVPEPDNLAEKILLTSRLNSSEIKPKKQYKVAFAMAASIAFIASLTFNIINFLPAPKTLGEYALGHLTTELDHITTDDLYSLEQVNVKLANYGGEIIDNSAPVHFANYCDFAGIKSLHLVIKDNHSFVTVFVIPKGNQFDNSKEFHDDTYFGKTIEAPNAKMMILSDKEEVTNKWQQKLSKDIKWKQA